MTFKRYDVIDGEWGATGESVLRSYIRKCGYEANKHPHGKYGLDIEYSSLSERFYVDVERRTSRTWRGSEWLSFPTLHVLARRPVSANVLFFTMSADMTKAYVSFPSDLEQVKPEPMDNIHAKGEAIRNHEIMRCLPLDLTKPIDHSIASMNASRIRALVREGKNCRTIMRALRGVGEYGFGAPYGVDEDEWKQMIFDVECRSGIGSYASRKIMTEHSQQTFAF